MPRVSPKAMIEDGAKLADDVWVGPFAYVGPEADIRAGCVIEAGASVLGRTEIGARTRVFPLAVVGAAPDVRAGRCIVGEANSLREHVTVYAGEGEPTRIGADNLIMIGSAVGAGATVGDHAIFANCTHIGPGAAVEDYVRTSAFPLIAAGVRVGAYTFVNGYAHVARDVPPFAIVEGDPVRVRGVNAENLRRCGFGDRDIRALKDAFRELYNGAGGPPNAKAVGRLLERAELNPHVLRAVEALRGSAGEPDA